MAQKLDTETSRQSTRKVKGRKIEDQTAWTPAERGKQLFGSNWRETSEGTRSSTSSQVRINNGEKRSTRKSASKRYRRLFQKYMEQDDEDYWKTLRK